MSSSDHFSPWSERQGESGFAWSWLGAALQRTTRCRSGWCARPGQRYHPAIIAQAIATLVEMFPGRLWVALGSGEASNEHITGDRWPDKRVRNARLRECVDVIRALLRGEEVTHDGLVRVDRARLWTLPDEPPALIGAAVSVETAPWRGGWADGLITVHQPPASSAASSTPSARAAARASRCVQVHVSWAPTDDEALAGRPRPVAHQRLLAAGLLATSRRVEHFEAAARHVPSRGPARPSVLVSADPARHAAWLARAAEVGVRRALRAPRRQEQQAFIEVFGEQGAARAAAPPRERA